MGLRSPSCAWEVTNSAWAFAKLEIYDAPARDLDDLSTLVTFSKGFLWVSSGEGIYIYILINQLIN